MTKTNFKQIYIEFIIDKILQKLSEFSEKDSGWSLYEVLQLKDNINKYDPILCGISTCVQIPKFIKTTRSVLNIQNNDEFCFLGSIVAALHPSPEGKNPNRTLSYLHFSRELTFDNIKFPIALKDIFNFENINNLSINVYSLDKKSLFRFIYVKPII